MSLHVDAVEFVWVVANLAAIVISLVALGDARADRNAVHLKNGPARTRVANGNVRREALRLVISLCLLGVAVPSLLVDRETPLSLPLVLLVAVPLLVLLNITLDLRDRRLIALMSLAAIEAERKGLSVTVTDALGDSVTTDATAVTATVIEAAATDGSES